MIDTKKGFGPQRPVRERKAGYMDNYQFRKQFNRLLSARAQGRAQPGQDFNRGQQQRSAYLGRYNTRSVPGAPENSSTLAQNAVRNRSREQGGNTPLVTPTQAKGETSRTASAMRDVIEGES